MRSVSVIIVTHNAENYIHNCLSSICESKIDLDVLHYGKEKNGILGLDLPSSALQRHLKNPLKFSFSFFKSLKYKNGVNGSLAYLINFFKNRKYDVIYCHFGTNGKLIAQLKSIGVIPSKTKIIVRFHGLDMLFSKYPVGYYKIMNQYVDKIIVGSNYAFNDLIKYNVRKDLLFKFPVGIKKVNFTSSTKLPVSDVIKIVSIGRLVEFKGHLQALKILRELNAKGTNFLYTIIGDGPQYSQICEMIQQYDLKSKVQVIKKLEHSKVIEQLQQSQIYLYPGIVDQNGRAETQGLANLEAMAQGLVFIGSNIGGVPDYVLSEHTGFLCEPNNVNEFADKLQWVIENYQSDTVMKVREKAVVFVKANYCQENLNENLLSLLKTV